MLSCLLAQLASGLLVFFLKKIFLRLSSQIDQNISCALRIENMLTARDESTLGIIPNYFYFRRTLRIIDSAGHTRHCVHCRVLERK